MYVYLKHQQLAQTQKCVKCASIRIFGMKLLTLQAAEKLIWYVQGRHFDVDEETYQKIENVWILLDQILTPMYFGMPRTPFKKLLHDEYLNKWCGCGCYLDTSKNPGLE